MAEPSLYKPPASLTASAPPLRNDQEGVATGTEQPEWEYHLKRGLALVVASCTAVVPFLSPTADEFAFKMCGVVIGIGAALGITSRGNAPKQRKR